MSRLDRIERGRKRATPEARERRREKRANLQEKFGVGRLRDRERRFVENFVALSAECFLVSDPAIKIGRSAVKAIAKKAATMSNGPPAKPAYQRESAGPRLIRMPRIQEAIEDALARADFSVEKRAQLIAEIGNDRDTAPEVRLRAAELGFKLTTGMAPSRQHSATVHVRGDRYYDEDVWEVTPPAEPVAGQELEGEGHD